MSDIVIRVRGEAADLESTMEDSANAVCDGATRMSDSLGSFAAAASTHADSAAGSFDNIAESAAAAAAGFAALQQHEIAGPLAAVAAGAESTAAALRVVGYGAEATANLFGRTSAAAQEQASASREVAAANQEVGSSWALWVAGGVAIAGLAVAAYGAYSTFTTVRDAVGDAASAVADWAEEVTGATATAAMFTEQAKAQADAMRLLTLQFGEQAQSFSHVAEISRDYGVSSEQAAAAIARLNAVLNPANEEFAQQRDILSAYGVSSKDAATALDQFARALTGVRDGASKTSDVIAVLGSSAPQWLKGIADGAGNVSHAYNEADRVVSVVAADIQASNERIAKAPHISWLGQLGDEWREVSKRVSEYVTRTDEFKAKQEYALEHVTIAWREYKADVASLGAVWEGLKQSASEYFNLVMHGSQGLQVAQKQGDNRPDSPAHPPEEAQSFSRSEVESNASRDLAEYQKGLQAKLLEKENWLRQDHALEVQYWQQSIADAKANEVEENSVLMGLLKERLAQAERSEAQYQDNRAQQGARAAEQASEAEKAAQLRGLQMMTDAAQKGSMERIQAAGAEVSYAFNAWGGMSSQYKAAMDRLLAADKEYEDQRKEILKIRTDADLQVARIGLQAEKDRLDAEVAAGNITVEQKIAALQTLTAAANQGELERLDKEIATLHEGDKAFEDSMAKRRVLVAQQAADTEKLANQQAEAERKAADKTAEAWMSAFSPAQRAADSMFQGMMQGTQTWSQVVSRAASNMAVSYGSSFLTMAAQFTAFKVAQQMGWDQITHGLQNTIRNGTFNWILGEQQKTQATNLGNIQRTGSLVTAQATQNATVITGQAQQTAATNAGAAARNAAGATEQSGFFTRIAEQIGEWLGFESAKTGSTVTEAASREAAEVSSTAAAIAASKAEAVGEIPAYAAIAAVAAMSSVAAIPYVGWSMAPGVGQATYAEAMAYLPMASAAGGWDEVPFDGARAVLHKEEMVLSSRYANPLRTLLDSVPVGGYGMPALGLGGGSGTASGTGSGSSAAGNGAGSQGPLVINAPLTVNAGSAAMGAAEFRAALDQHANHVARAADKGRRQGVRDRR